MMLRAVLARPVWLVVMVIGFVFAQAPARAARVTLGWDVCNNPLLAGYMIVYGTNSGDYTLSSDAGTNTSATVGGLTPGTTYYFAIYPYDTNNNPGPLSSEIVYDVPAAPTFPEITDEPASQSVEAGSTAVLSVGAIGAAPISYQWLENAQPLDGATNASLILPNVSDANAGNYSVLVVNSLGTALSTVATLSVVDVPMILIQPVSQTVIAGSTTFFTVAAASPTPLTYQWYDNSIPLPGATTATLTLPNANDTNGGDYEVVIDNSAGSVTSSIVSLSIVDPPVITLEPVSQTVGAGSDVVFRAGVYGTAPFSFQWYYLGVALPQAQSRALSLTSVSASDAGGYYLTVQNAAGSARSTRAVLTVTNIFALTAGVYNGLFYQTNSALAPRIDAQSAGLLGNCAVGGDGTYSASVSLGGSSYPLTGSLGATGSDTEVVSRVANGLSNLVVTLNLDMTGLSQSMTGSVSNTDPTNPWNASLVALLATNALPVPPGAWYMTIPPANADAPDSPQGYAIISISPAGVATMAGNLYDGTSIVQSVPVCGNGSIPLYFSLYRGSGLIEGWISMAGGLPTGTVTWIRPAGASSPVPYPDGFTNVVNIY
jgi:hypothetical protein